LNFDYYDLSVCNINLNPSVLTRRKCQPSAGTERNGINLKLLPFMKKHEKVLELWNC
jgi:hypothetical protein